MSTRTFTIVGAGQAGLQLGIALLGDGHSVTIVSNRTPVQIAEGKVTSSQCMFDTAQSYERELGLAFWDEITPPVEGIAFAVPSPAGDGSKALDWAGRLDAVARSVDQRVKMPRWIDEFIARGGEFVIGDAGVDELEQYAAESDLVLIAAGKGEIAGLFERDEEKSPYAAPQRALALTYVNGLTPRAEHSAVAFNLIPGVGEYFVFPALTTTGPCEIMVFEAVPGGPMDLWKPGMTPEEHLATSLHVLETFVPWEAERARDVTLTDDNGVLAGRFAPTVRKPVATLPSGATVLGLADVVVLNDPITGQGSNNASKCAQSYLTSIREQTAAGGDFDEAFKQGAFDRYWENAKHATQWTNALLAPPPPFVLEVLGAAGQFPEIAHRFANGFDDPRDYATWFLSPEGSVQYVQEVAERAGVGA
jgi:hypothetical protein